jgi:hypothetical protein
LIIKKLNGIIVKWEEEGKEMKFTKSFFAAILTVTLILGNLISNINIVKAENYDAKPTAIVYDGTVDNIQGVPGETVHVKLPVKAIGGYVFDPVITVDTKDMPFTVSKITYTQDGYSGSLAGISNLEKTYIEFDLYVKESAGISRNKVTVNVEFNLIDQDDASVDTFNLTLPTVYLIISEEKEPAQLTVDNINLEDTVIGSDTKLTFTIKNEGEISALSSTLTIDGYSDAGIIPTYSKLKQKIGSEGTLKPGDTYNMELPVTISGAATAGSKKLIVKMQYKNEEGEASEDSVEIYVTLQDDSSAPKIEILSTKYASQLKAGDSFNLVTTLRNVGQTKADDIEVSIGGLATTGFLPGYTSKTIAVKDLKYKDKADVKIPLIVSNEATVGLKEVPITITYKDKASKVITTTSTLYLEVVTADGVDSSGKPNIVIGNVNQSPDAPNAGARVEVSFALENKSKVDISDVKISVVSANGASFAPLESEPYQYIEKIAGGKTANITLPLRASDTITEGTNSVDIKYEYKDANGKTWSDNTATLYVLNVQNNGVGTSKPKLIISNFSTDEEELKAGSVFNFKFDIKNTHNSVDARNIKVTISQADNIFSVTKGSNTFYITEISAGETVENNIELRVKSDATTKAYPIIIKMEYEYEGAEANPTTGEIGETAEETINLQAVENSRPVVDNITVGSWDAPIVNQPTTLSFQFYNMGKSALNNVHASVEGDFYLSTGNMYFIGNVEAGGQEYAEMEVIPTLEGQAKGTLIVTFEDSNGDEVTVKKEFEGAIQGETIIPPGGEGTGGEIPPAITAKAAILPTWAFILIQVAIVVIALPVSRKVVLNLHRKKLRKQEEME